MDIAQLAARRLAREKRHLREWGRMGMKIVVAIKQVPERDAQVRIAANGKWIEEGDLQYAMNEPDAYALEEALRLKEKYGGEVVVVSAGPERVGTVIREALAKGADRGIHIVGDDVAGRDALGRGAAAGGGDQAGRRGPGVDRIAIGRCGHGPNRGDCGRVAGAAARDVDPAGGKDRGRAQGKAGTRRGVVSDDRIVRRRRCSRFNPAGPSCATPR